MKKKLRFFIFIRVIISLTLIGLLLYVNKNWLTQAVEAIKGLKYTFFLLASLVFMLSVTIIAARLKVLLYAQGLYLKYTESLYLTFIGYFFNSFLPTSIGGDVVKAYYTYKKTDKKIKSFISVFMDRFTGLLSLFMLAAVSLFFSYRYIDKGVLAGVIAAALFVFLFAFLLLLKKESVHLFPPLERAALFFRKNHMLKEIFGVMRSFKDKKILVIQAMFISAAGQVVCFMIIYFLSKGLGASIPIKMVLLFMPIVSIVSMLPLTLNGLGVREYTICLLFGPYVGNENALVLSLVWLSMLLMTGFIGGVSYMLKKEKI